MKELLEQAERIYKRRLPKLAAESLSLSADGDQIIVRMCGESHVFVGSYLNGCIQAFNFLDTIRIVNEDAFCIRFDELFVKYLGFLESLALWKP